jgi:membrane associated rhomboid family serine protease
MDIFRKVKDNFQRQGVLTQIIIINVVVFLMVNIVGNVSPLNLVEYLGLPIGGDKFLFRFWTFLTYMFTHAGLGHVFWNMVIFYFMSQIFFTIMGQKKLLSLYIMSGLAGGVLVLLLGLVFPASFGHSVLIGASAAVMGVGAVMAVYAPDYRVYLFGIFELSYKYFYLLVFTLNTIIDLSVNTGGKISHIGGAVFGLLYGYYLKQGRDLLNVSLKPRRKKHLKVVSRNSDSGLAKKQKEEYSLDELLDKISKSGYDSLTKREKEELFRLSQKK